MKNLWLRRLGEARVTTGFFNSLLRIWWGR